MDRLTICFGWEMRESIGDALFQFSAVRRTSVPLVFYPLMERALRYRNLYWRPHEQRNGQLWCPISDAPMATSFANSRFLVPWLTDAEWCLFADGADMLWQADPAELFELADDRYAVMVVKREHDVSRETSRQVADSPSYPPLKMDGQIQTSYPRKNWSSVILWNLTHPANVRGLTLQDVNERPGRDLHRFCWLKDSEIGELPPEWNWLVGIDPDEGSPKLLHFTSGLPVMRGYEAGPWADVWRRELAILDATRERLPIGKIA